MRPCQASSPIGSQWHDHSLPENNERGYQVGGNLFLASLETLSPYGKDCALISKPFPIYLTGSCCPDPEHALNRAVKGIHKKKFSDAVQLWKVIRDQRNALVFTNLKVVNPLWIMAVGKMTDGTLQASTDSFWWDDRVHPTDSDYAKLLNNLSHPLAKNGMFSPGYSHQGKTSRQPWRPPRGSWPSGSSRGRHREGGPIASGKGSRRPLRFLQKLPILVTFSRSTLKPPYVL
jgi:hypothetical protein